MDETEILLTEILNCKRHELYLNKKIALDRQETLRLKDSLARRMHGEPIQYILKKSQFMGLEFKVNQDVFIPRPETEIMIEEVIRLVNPLCLWAVGQLNILDIGTGSGCIAISLARYLKDVKITATDISEEALVVARENALFNNVLDKIKFIQRDVFADYGLGVRDYELIISNPPYIPEEDMADLPDEVKFEPPLALNGGRKGLRFYRQIVKKAPFLLKDKGYLFLEIGFGQLPALKNLFKNSKKLKIIDIVKDYAGIDRVIIAGKQNG